MHKEDIYRGIEEHFEAMLSREGRKHSNEKRKILKVFLEIDDHCTVQDIARRLESQGSKISEGLIRDTMESFCRYGISGKRRFEGKDVLYEHLYPGSHHDHFVCIKCGKIIEFTNHEMEKIQYRIARRSGFYPLHHLMEMYGLCSACYEDRKDILPLVQASPGERLVIEQLQCGRGMANRLNSLGLTVGTRLEVIGNPGFGPVLVAVRGSRLGLGHEMAQKIMVCPVGDGDFQEDSADMETSGETERPSPKRVETKKAVEKNLSQLREGQRGVIKRIAGRGYFRHRLMEMGFTPGSEVYVEKYAPLKDPIEYILKGYHVSLRRGEAANVIIEEIG
ncbi:MAG: FeoA domain-containing protein [Deltaproteobacteria bacterium]|nr:FeoA domain-containing protein [Deltaproteobacteria bacterium]